MNRLALIKSVPLLVFAASVASAQAGSIVFPLDYKISGDKPVGTSPYASLLLEDVGSDVRATLSFNTSPGDAGEFITALHLNTDKLLTASYLTAGVASFTGLDSAPQPLGGVRFDYSLGFTNRGNQNRFTPGESIRFTLSSIGGLSTLDFLKAGTHPGNDPTKDGILVGIKIQGIPGGGSAEIGSTAPVPEPASMAALCLGVTALIRRRRAKSRGANT